MGILVIKPYIPLFFLAFFCLFIGSEPILTPSLEINERNNSLSFLSVLYENNRQFELVLEVTNVFNPSCTTSSDGVIILKTSGGSGKYEYHWSHDSALDESFAINLSAGTYLVSVRDLETGDQSELEVTLESPEEIELEISSIQYPGCESDFSGEIILDITGGTPPFKAVGFNSTWDNNQLIIFDLSAGQYQFVISDSKSCSKIIRQDLINTDPLVIDFVQTSPECSDELSGKLEVNVSGGIPPYEFIWEDGTTGSEIVGLPIGKYEVTVTDANNCSFTASGEVYERVPEVRLPTGFDPSLGLYEPIASCTISYELLIFSQWGELIYSGSEGWDGQFSGEIFPGIFTYYISYTYKVKEDTFFEEQRGSFTLIR